MSTPNSVYHSGMCRVLSWSRSRHEVWCGETHVATFTTFRQAVKYICAEFEA